MNVFGAFQGKDYIAGTEFLGKRPGTLTIREVRKTILEEEKGRTKGAPVVFFQEIKRGWVLCKTNASCLAAMFGEETDKWTGKRVTLYAAQVHFGGEKVTGIRIAGSPDIREPVSFTLRLARKKPQRMVMKPTPKGEVVVPEEPSEVPEEAPPSDAPPPDDVPGWNAGGEAP